jgi:Uma2 family endonuclease
MVATPQPPYFSPEEYLQIEAKSLIKHEYIDGQIYAMVGVSDAHNVIAGNLITLLRNHLRGSGCRVYFSDMKARIESRNRFFYPDLMITCDSRDSDATEAFDRGDKFENYRALESLREYVLISSKRFLVECYRRNETEQWVLETYTQELGSFQLQSLNFSGTLHQLYEDVELPS